MATYVKDKELTAEGFGTYKEAAAAALIRRAHFSDPDELRYRVRVRFRTRTGRWDVVVKTRREASANEEKAS